MSDLSDAAELRARLRMSPTPNDLSSLVQIRPSLARAVRV